MTSATSQYPTLSKLNKKLALPMLFLSFTWLAVLVIELAYGTSPVLSGLGSSIWALFILYFSLRIIIAEKRISLLLKNWLFVLAMLVSILRFFPLLQPFPFVRAVTASFGMQVIWIFVSADQGMRSIRRMLGRRGTGYAVAFTLIVIFAGAAGMLHFEKVSDDPRSIDTFPNAVWWTAMQMTNIGSSYTLKTTGGRILGLAISIYAAAMFGYLTALFATFIIDRDTKEAKAESTRQTSLQEMQKEMALIRKSFDEIASTIGCNGQIETRQKHERGKS